MTRIAKGSGRKKQDVQELMQKFGMMQQVMGSIGQNPGPARPHPRLQAARPALADEGHGPVASIFGKDAKMMEQALGGGGGGCRCRCRSWRPGYTAADGPGARWPRPA